jgi:hypothetical protein
MEDIFQQEVKHHYLLNTLNLRHLSDKVFCAKSGISNQAIVLKAPNTQRKLPTK